MMLVEDIALVRLHADHAKCLLICNERHTQIGFRLLVFGIHDRPKFFGLRPGSQKQRLA